MCNDVFTMHASGGPQEIGHSIGIIVVANFTLLSCTMLRGSLTNSRVFQGSRRLTVWYAVVNYMVDMVPALPMSRTTLLTKVQTPINIVDASQLWFSTFVSRCYIS